MTFYNQHSADTNSFIKKQPGNMLNSTGLHAGTILKFLQDAMGTTASAWLAPIVHFAGKVPALSGNILEIHFGKEENNIDFATRLNLTFDRGLMTGVKSRYYQLPFVNNNFTSCITQAGDEFTGGIQNIWIEYDAPFNGAPALFFDIDKEKTFCPQTAYGRLQQITTAFHFQTNPFLLRFLENVQKEGLFIVYYGLMFSRNSRSVRLTINGIEPENLAATLIRLGWKGNLKALEELTSTYLKKGQKLVIGVDVGDGIANRIGIEVFDEDKGAFIETLYSNNQINTSQFELLNSWERSLTLPADLSSALTSLHQRSVSTLYTRINHFKFVIDAAKPIETKGYLYYCF